MANVRIIGKKGSQSRKAISDATGIGLYTGQTGIDAVINYGLAGDRLHAALNKYKNLKNIPMLNKYVGLSKFLVVKKAAEKNILVPESKNSLSKNDRLSDWIEKRVHSSQGNGIIAAHRRSEIAGKYYQRMIKDRRYEFRVHAFRWLPKEEWTINKRIGPADQIAWNFHQGGHFQSVRYPNKYQVFLDAKEISVKILEMLNMAFGAVDLIVDNDMKVYFIEVNSSPGFSEFNRSVYVNAMNELKNLSAREISKLGRK